MPIPAWTVSDFFSAFLRLLPRGRAWSRDVTTVQNQSLASLMPTYVRNAASARNLLIDGFPATTTQILPDWEASLGLPDKCTPLGVTLQQRRAAVVEKFTRGGGQSVNYYIAVALRLGYVVTITEDAASTFVWRVHVAETVSVQFFRVGANRTGDRLEYWFGNTQLECVFNQIKPAHTTVIFSYGS